MRSDAQNPDQPPSVRVGVARWRLCTLGRLSLLDPDGREDPSLATRPRKLAVLAWLALRSGRRATRDRLIGVFWGGRSEERARNSLSDVLSHLRRVLGRDAIRAQADDVIIADEAALEIDALALARAQAAGDHERVVQSYAGPFLEGVYIDDAPEFEDWRDRERARLAALFGRSAAVHCADLARDARWDDCRALAERWLDAEPASADAALCLLNAIGAPGNHASRVAVLEAYKSLVRRLEHEVGVAPDVQVTALAHNVAAELAAKQGPPLVSAVAVRVDVEHSTDDSSQKPSTPASLDSPIAASRSPAAPRRRRARAVYALAACTILVALGLVALRPPDPTVGRRRVVVAPLENLTTDASLDAVGHVASQWIAQNITQAESLDVVSPATVSIIVGDARGSYAELLQRLTARTGARFLVAGGYTRRGDSLQFEVHVTDARTGRLVRALDPAVGLARDPIATIDVLRDRVLGALAPEDRATIGLSTRVPRYTAYQEFLQGHERFIRYRDYAAARKFLRHAIELDSSLAVAWAYLANSYYNQGMYDSMEVVVRSLADRRDRLTRSELHFLDYLDANLHGDTRRAVAAQQAIAARDSNPIWLYVLGLDAMHLNQPRLALKALAGSDSAAIALNWHSQLTVAADAYHEAGQHADELSTLERARRIFPNVRPVANRELIALAALHRAPQALSLADSTLAATVDTTGTEVGVLVTGAMEFVAHGDTATALTLARQALAWWGTHPVVRRATNRAVSEALAFRLVGRLDSAEILLASAARDSTAITAAGLLAATHFQRTGDRAALQRAADSLGALDRKWLFGAQHATQAGLLAWLGDHGRAMGLLRRAIDEGQPMQVLHRSPLLQPLWADPAFKALLVPSG